MGDIRRLRTAQQRSGFAKTLQARGIVPKSAEAIQLARTIGELRKAEHLPAADDEEIQFWGAERCWARRIGGHELWLLYVLTEDGDVTLWAVHNHVHQ